MFELTLRKPNPERPVHLLRVDPVFRSERSTMANSSLDSETGTDQGHADSPIPDLTGVTLGRFRTLRNPQLTRAVGYEVEQTGNIVVTSSGTGDSDD